MSDCDAAGCGSSNESAIHFHGWQTILATTEPQHHWVTFVPFNTTLGLVASGVDVAGEPANAAGGRCGKHALKSVE